MGLDSCFFKVHKHNKPKLTDQNTIWYFRKNWALHSWMQDLLIKKNKTTHEFSDLEVHHFNGIFMKLTEQDMENLMLDLLHGKLDWEHSLFETRTEFEKEMSEMILKVHRLLKIYDIYYEGDY